MLGRELKCYTGTPQCWGVAGVAVQAREGGGGGWVEIVPGGIIRLSNYNLTSRSSPLGQLVACMVPEQNPMQIIITGCHGSPGGRGQGWGEGVGGERLLGPHMLFARHFVYLP